MSSGVPPTTAAWSFARFMGLFWSSVSSQYFALFTCPIKNPVTRDCAGFCPLFDAQL
jgi:hypothetical protein